MTESQTKRLKSAGFRRDEISHFKAGRFSKISKKRLKEIKQILEPKPKRENKPLVITADGVTLKKSKYIIIIK